MEYYTNMRDVLEIYDQDSLNKYFNKCIRIGLDKYPYPRYYYQNEINNPHEDSELSFPYEDNRIIWLSINNSKISLHDKFNKLKILHLKNSNVGKLPYLKNLKYLKAVNSDFILHEKQIIDTINGLELFQIDTTLLNIENRKVINNNKKIILDDILKRIPTELINIIVNFV